MPTSDITQSLAASKADDALSRHFIVVWPVIESILSAFSKATELPIFAYLNGLQVFRSSNQAMPRFCQLMLGNPDTEAQCIADGKRRADRLEPDRGGGVQHCLAGMLNGRREIDTGVGALVILFGAKLSAEPTADKRRLAIIGRAAEETPELASDLTAAAEVTSSPFTSDDIALLDAIANILQRLLSATVGFRTQTINMAHELCLMLDGLGLWVMEMEDALKDFKSTPENRALVEDMTQTQQQILTQSRMGLYIVRNFLSHASETRYSEVVRAHFTPVDIREVLVDMVDLHRLQATQKKIVFDLSKLDELPSMRGAEMELRRLFYNILNNAIKYSYHSVPTARRIIRVRSRVPFDPGFKRRRFSISVENYGLGITDEEKANVFKSGFRGEQARSEVPIGSGIGLSEAQKIMKAHRGEIRFNSKELYEDEHGGHTYLTTVDLIFPYVGGDRV